MKEKTLKYYLTAIEQTPEDATLYNAAAVLLYNTKQFKDAETYFLKAIQLKPEYAESCANLGALYAKFKQYEKAIKLYQHSIKLKPSYAGAYTNLGNALNKTKRYEEAVYFHRTAIALDAKSANHFSNCASAYKNLGRFNKAKVLYKKAISLEPNHVNAHFDLATVLLQTGDYKEGWQEYEWRFQKDEMKSHLQTYRTIFEKSRYQGEILHGERVLVHAEQGFGDTLMMARYLALLKARGATVVLYLREGLRELFEMLSCVDEIYIRGETLKKFDYQLPFMSLPFVLDKELKKITLHYPTFLIQEKIPLNENKIKIGIVWGASKTGDSYENKVFDLRHFKILSKHKQIALYSLQLGEDKDDIIKYGMQDDIIDLSKTIDNFYTTAKLINALDLVITSDTSVAHLCGSMGKKVWIILQKVPDWRWGVNENYSRWYPSAKLFYQYSLGDFNSAFKQVYVALENEFKIKVMDV